MSGIIGAVTPGRIAFALSAIGVGALVGGVVADRRDSDVRAGALIGGASALAGLALLVGGRAAWRHISSARAGATTGAIQAGTTLAHAPVAVPTLSTSLASQIRSTAARLLDDAAQRTALLAPRIQAPFSAATPSLPVASSGSTFLSTLTRFVT